MNKILSILNNDELINKIGKNCNDKHHDNRWCPTCESRLNGIYDFIEEIKKEINCTITEAK